MYNCVNTMGHQMGESSALIEEKMAAESCEKEEEYDYNNL